MAQDPEKDGTIDQPVDGSNTLVPSQEGNGEVADTLGLRFLRHLVTVLTVVMIFGMIAVVTLFYLRFQPVAAPGPQVPERIALPEGATAQAVTTGPGWLAVVTQDGRILFFDAETGALTREVLREE